MGTTFSTIQIQNRQHMEPEQFNKTLLRYLKKKGLVPTTREKAHTVCSYIFSDDGSWITLSSSEYEIGSDSVDSDVRGLAKALKTCCIKTSVFDSDALFLYLFDAPSKQKDMVALGRLEDMSDSESTVGIGNSECWNPILIESATWEQLIKVWKDEHVFAEELLVTMAPLLGMDSKNVTTDYHYWNEIEPDNPRVVTLYFETETPLLIAEGPTKLGFSMWTPAAILSGTESVVSFYNIGGISKGLTVLMLGDCFEHDSVGIAEIKVEKCKSLNDFYGERIATTVLPTKEQTSDGRFGLSFELDDFEFHEGVNSEHPSVKSLSKKALDTLLSHSVFLRFTAAIQSGSKHSFSFHVIPHTNWTEGQDGRPIDVYETQEQMYEERGGLGNLT